MTGGQLLSEFVSGIVFMRKNRTDHFPAMGRPCRKKMTGDTDEIKRLDVISTGKNSDIE